MEDNTNKGALLKELTDEDLGDVAGGSDIQFRSAKLQLMADEATQGNTTDIIAAIEAARAEQKQVAKQLQDARQAKADAQAVGAEYDEFDIAIRSLQAQLDYLGDDTNQKLVFVQDYMGQYNSYLQSSNGAI